MFCKLLACKNLKTWELFKFLNLKVKLQCTPTSILASLTYLFLALYGSTTIQTRSFLKNIENFLWFPKQYLLDFFILEKQLAIIPDRGFLFLCNTLLLYSPSPYWRTERRTESNTLATRGLKYAFFQLCCCVSFLFWQEIGFGFTYYLHT